MNPQLHLSQEDLEAAFQELDDGENLIAVADALGIPALRLSNLYNARLKPEPVPEEPNAVAKKNKKKISESTKNKILAALKRGETRKAVADAHGVHVSSVDNIKYRAKNAAPVTKPTRAEKTEPSIRDQRAAEKFDGFHLSFEGDYLVVKIPRKKITATLLRDLL